VVALRKEETGVLVMELSEHLWPEDLELAIPVVRDVARSRQNPLLLLVEVSIPEAQIRFFSPHQRFEAKAWLLSFATPFSLPPILG